MEREPVTVEVEQPGDGPRAEIVSHVRGREVRCWIEDGRVHGDSELIERLARLAPLTALADPVSLAHRVYDAVGSPVEIRLTETIAADPSHGEPNHPARTKRRTRR